MLKAPLLLWSALALGAGGAHGPRGIQVLPYSSEQIQQVTSLWAAGRQTMINGTECISGGNFHIDVRDDFAFDIDESVWLDVDFYEERSSSKVTVSYDRNGVAPVAFGGQALPAATRASNWMYRSSMLLERARFANSGFAGSDIALYSERPTDMESRDLTICRISLRRTYQTPVVNAFGRVLIEIVDEHGRTTPARMGLYDVSGRLPLPSDEAVPVRHETGSGRIVAQYGASAWPAENRSAFYVNGSFSARLPVGEYRLVVAKGLEYRWEQRRLEVKSDETRKIQIKLKRWVDMVTRGWYSGDTHIHHTRESSHDDHNLLLVTRSEDLRVANVLQMGDSATIHYPQYSWRPQYSATDPGFVLVPGQEDPRMSRRGHAVALNIQAPVRNPTRYPLYHEVFEQVRLQNGLIGYAHATSDNDWLNRFNAVGGMAIDVPFGLVDLVEVLSLDVVGTSTWFDFLNMGYKLVPTAGTDFPGGGIPGAVRNYVKLDEPFTLSGWFEALRQGRTFVTSGPMLDISINGHGPGAEIKTKHGESLAIHATVESSPDLAGLVDLELIEQGELVEGVKLKREASKLSFRHSLLVEHGTWFVLRARASDGKVLALSAPIYVVIDGHDFWKPSAVPAIAASMKNRMQQLLHSDVPESLGSWVTQPADAMYRDALQGELESRIDRANTLYDDLVKRASLSAKR